MEELIQLFVDWDKSSYVMLGLLVAIHLIRKFFKVKLEKYDKIIQIAVNELVLIMDKQFEQFTNGQKHSTVADNIYDNLPKYIKIFISKDFIDKKIISTVDKMKVEKAKVADTVAKTVIKLDTEDTKTSIDLGNIVEAVKKDTKISLTAEPDLKNLEKSRIGIKFKTLFKGF